MNYETLAVIVPMIILIGLYVLAVLPFKRKLLKHWLGYDCYEMLERGFDTLVLFAAFGAWLAMYYLFDVI